MNSQIERRFVKIDGQWRLMKLNAQDPRYDDSEPYDESKPNNGRPEQDDAPRSVREAAKQQAADLQRADAERAAQLGPDGPDADNGDDAGTKSGTAANKARSTRSTSTTRRGSRSTSSGDAGDDDSAKDKTSISSGE